MKALTKPPRVEVGMTVAVVSPSFGGLGIWPHRVERATRYLESLGLRLRIMPNAGRSEGWASAPPVARAADLHEAFLDEEVAVVIAGIGGNHSNQLLPLLDYELIRDHPKVFQGYSDITILHWALAKHAGLSTFHGPMLVTELAEFPQVLPYTHRSLHSLWFGNEPYFYEPADVWTDEFLDFNQKLDLTRARELRPSEGWIAIREGKARGPLLGGCLETICWHLKGSPSWIDPQGAILFLETTEEAPSPATVDAYLTDLEQLGVFDEAAGLLFARPYGYTEERAKLLLDVIATRTDAAGLPVLANLEVGHTDPMLTLPLGVEAEVDTGVNELRLLERATSEPRGRSPR